MSLRIFLFFQYFPLTFYAPIAVMAKTTGIIGIENQASLCQIKEIVSKYVTAVIAKGSNFNFLVFESQSSSFAPKNMNG